MEFHPSNKIVKLCLQGMEFEASGRNEVAASVFRQAWDESTAEFEKFLSAYYLSRHQDNVAEKLKWLERALALVLKINDDASNGALPSLYSKIADCHDELGETEQAKKHRDLAASHQHKPSDKGPFYHGTKADLKTGDLLTAGGLSNYQSALTMNHIYFSAMANGAGLAAALAKGEGHERVYIVEPTGTFENDPNVTDKKFPGNPTRSYRSTAPLKIVGEVKEWVRMPDEEFKKWREKINNNQGEIIN